MSTLIEFIHANHNTPIAVVKGQVFSFYYSATHKCVLLLASGGAMIPVKESYEEVKQKLQE
jgi:uncharacterized protein YlzI (FlbEa/FlbD family)